VQNKDYNHLKCGDIIKGVMVEETLSSVNKPKVSEKYVIKHFVTGTFYSGLHEHVLTFRIKRPGLDPCICGQLLTFRNG
jgi:hypothetical protein